MRKLSVVFLLVAIAASVPAESFFLPAYRTSRTKTIAWGSVGIAGVVLTILGLSASSASAASDEVDFTPILVSGLGGGMATLGGILAFTNGSDLVRYDKAMDVENRLSQREKEAIVTSRIFVGMSEQALRLSWGNPTSINRSSYGPDQYVYGYRYVYVEGNRVDGWN